MTRAQRRRFDALGRETTGFWRFVCNFMACTCDGGFADSNTLPRENSLAFARARSLRLDVVLYTKFTFLVFPVRRASSLSKHQVYLESASTALRSSYASTRRLTV